MMSGLVLLASLILCIAPAEAQSNYSRLVVRPWLGASLGFGTFTVDRDSHGGLAGDVLAGLELGGGLRFGLRGAGFAGISLGDQPSWGSSSALFVTGYAPPRWPMAITAGIGRLWWRENGGIYAGRSGVLETGVELFVPPRHGVSLRGFGALLFPLSQSVVPSTPTFAPPKFNGQYQMGFGFAVH